MEKITFTGTLGDFRLENAQRYPGIYFPLVNEGPLISSITPLLGGDCKTDQNTFLLAPASSETLHESRANRNFWVCIDGFLPWSAAGQSALQQSAKYTDQEEECVLEGGLLWQRITRKHAASGLKAEILSFVPSGNQKIEIMQVTLTNESDKTITFTPIAAVPLYGRSADNIRDHRHVTSLLQRVTLSEYGLNLQPTLTFDERGHQKGDVTYRVWGSEGEGVYPAGFVPLVRDFVGSSSYDWPEAVLRHKEITLLKSCDSVQGSEIIGAIYFNSRTLNPGCRQTYQILLSIGDDPTPFLHTSAVEDALVRTKQWWQEINPITVTTGNPEFDSWCRWVGIQPVLRRICGCSFMPHHDYGRGGRGWRDLWQDSLALILQNPQAVRQDLLNYFSGVRTDGTNATIIGTRPGEFKADRNNIPRVWMDHGFWPLLTVELYLNETGDNAFLLEERPYFRDTLAHRGEGAPLASPGTPKTGTVLEHLLIQNITAYFDVGENGNMRLRGADWNDGLDMAGKRGESVAFTAAYAGNLDTLANRIAHMEISYITLSKPLINLLRCTAATPSEKCNALYHYCIEMEASTSSEPFPTSELISTLRHMGNQLKQWICEQEWISDHSGHSWFNSYYDDHALQVEGVFESGIRMMLTGQVFTILSGTADHEQVRKIIASADQYLFAGKRGGYCLNTDFHEVKLDMGRMFGFGYGTKENGAVFCHMAIMYAYSLYSRGFTEEGWKVLDTLFKQSMNFAASKTLPGIPEYFDDRGQGMYPYLTGSGSWWMLTLQTQIFGVRGINGDISFNPQLSHCHFNKDGIAAIHCHCAGRELTVHYHGPGQSIDEIMCRESGEVWKESRICANCLPQKSTLDIYLK